MYDKNSESLDQSIRSFAQLDRAEQPAPTTEHIVSRAAEFRTYLDSEPPKDGISAPKDERALGPND